ncbi:MAG: YraN family protein [Pseudomonadota bacterium]
MSAGGEQAETQAAALLAARGLRLVQRNYRCRFGEIDLIMRDGKTLVFVEVRARTHRGYGGAAASIDANKQARVVRAARHYLATLRELPACRFDAVLFEADGTAHWIPSAFEV